LKKNIYFLTKESALGEHSTGYFPAGVFAAFVIGYSHVNDVTSEG